MSEKPSIEELAQQINKLSTEEQAELIAKINLDQIIKYLPKEQREKLFNKLNLFWRIEDFEDNEDDQIYFYRLAQNKKRKDLKILAIGTHLIECVRYTDNSTNEIQLSFESRIESFSSSRYTIPIPTTISKELLDYIEFHIMELIATESQKVMAAIGETTFKGLKRVYPNDFKNFQAVISVSKNPKSKAGYKGDLKDFELITHIWKRFYQHHDIQIDPAQQEEGIRRFAYYKNLYEIELKELKAHFKKLYKNLNHKLPIEKRENKVRKLLLKEKSNLTKKIDLTDELLNKIGLKFRPADEAIILAAKSSCLNPFSKNGKISSQIRKTLKIGQQLLEKEAKTIPD